MHKVMREIVLKLSKFKSRDRLCDINAYAHNINRTFLYNTFKVI